MKELAKQIEDSNITEEELKVEGWGCLCCNLTKDLADNLKARNPGSVILNDDLNPGGFVVMKLGFNPNPEKAGEYSVERRKTEENKNEIHDEAGQNSDRQTDGQIPDKQNPICTTQNWFDS